MPAPFLRAQIDCIVGQRGKSLFDLIKQHPGDGHAVLLETPGIGAIPLDLPATGHHGKDPEFLLEGDEYVISPEDRRSKFVLYHPTATLISSLVHDHLNMFPTMDSYVAPFAELVKLTPEDGLLVCAHRYAHLHEITKGRKVVWYGLDKCDGYYAENIRIGEK